MSYFFACFGDVECRFLLTFSLTKCLHVKLISYEFPSLLTQIVIRTQYAVLLLSLSLRDVSLFLVKGGGPAGGRGV